jgi:hypothetical protein
LVLPVILSSDGSGQEEQVSGGGEIGGIEELVAREVEAVEFLAEEMRAGIAARYAGLMVAARNSLPRDQVMGVIQSLKAQRNAELAQVKAKAAEVLQSRIRAALAAHRARQWKPSPEAKP